jgi:hypothetical protein
MAAAQGLVSCAESLVPSMELPPRWLGEVVSTGGGGEDDRGRVAGTVRGAGGMNEYHKIQTVFLRDPETKFKTLLRGQYAEPEFEYLAENEWVFTEKVDGTNIRVMIREGNITFGGKTDNASIPALLLWRLTERFLRQHDKIAGMFPDGGCLYGEGYGARIQKGGGNYRPDQDFVLFDVKVGDWWLQRSAIEDISQKLMVDIVPIIGRGTLPQMVERAEVGFKSRWGDFEAEVIVARPSCELKTRSGHRIITKIKTRDFAEGAK